MDNKDINTIYAGKESNVAKTLESMDKESKESIVGFTDKVMLLEKVNASTFRQVAESYLKGLGYDVTYGITYDRIASVVGSYILGDVPLDIDLSNKTIGAHEIIDAVVEYLFNVYKK